MTYCTAPWNGLTVREDGSVRVCCAGSQTLGNVNNESITKIYNNQSHQSIKKQLLAGEPDENCKNCIEAEKISGSSLRRHYNENYPTIDNDSLKFLDIRWNSFCNLHCIYCNEQFSTTWAEKINPGVIKILKNNFDQELEQWILERAVEIHELILVGGEPLLMKQNYSLIKKIPDSTRLSIITNLSYNLKNNPVTEALFARPVNNTIWNISAENYGDQYEYIRNGASYVQFEDNLKLLVENNPNNISMLMVYGLFSALNLFDTVKHFHSLGIKKICLQPVGANPALDLFSFPKEILEQALEQLEQTISWQKKEYDLDYKFYEMNAANSIISKLKDRIANYTMPSITKDKFNAEIKKYDKWHTTSFSKLWAKEFQLINRLLK
jgi:radical SAM protein with 4Fe4S-binding SPASM domain